MSLRNRKLRDNSGVAVIEFAILLPVFLLLLFGIIEFGLFFIKYEIVGRAVSIICMTIQNPYTPNRANYYSLLGPEEFGQTIKSYGSGVVDFTKADNYICADAYPYNSQNSSDVLTSAVNAPPCTSTHFFPPIGPGFYYIAVRVNLPKGGVTPLGNFIAGIGDIRISRIPVVISVSR